MASADAAVADVLRDTRRYVLRSADAHCVTTEVDSVDEGLRRVDAVLKVVESDGDLQAAWALFVPTGWLQDLSIAAGWGEEFLALAARLDASAG